MFTYIAGRIIENKIRRPELAKVLSYKSYNLRIIIIYTYHKKTNNQNNNGSIKNNNIFNHEMYKREEKRDFCQGNLQSFFSLVL